MPPAFSLALILTLLLSITAQQNLATDETVEAAPEEIPIEQQLLARIIQDFPQFVEATAVSAVLLPNPVVKFENDISPPQRFAFTFVRNNNTLKTIVSLLEDPNSGEQRLNTSPFIDLTQPQKVTLKGHNLPLWVNTTEFITAYTSTLTPTPSSSAIIPGVLGGFSEFPDQNDVRLVIAVDYIQNRHPVLLTYSILETRVQIVQGTNVWIRFRSPNALKIVETIVFVDLSFTPNLLEFHAQLSNAVLTQDSLAFQLYTIEQAMLTFFDDLAEFQPTSVTVQPQIDGKRFISLTCDHQTLEIRTLIDLEITGQVIEILSKYSFSFPSALTA